MYPASAKLIILSTYQSLIPMKPMSLVWEEYCSIAEREELCALIPWMRDCSLSIRKLFLILEDFFSPASKRKKSKLRYNRPLVMVTAINDADKYKHLLIAIIFLKINILHNNPHLIFAKINCIGVLGFW